MAFEINNNTGDRRPIATRETRLAKRAATYLVQLGFSPNGISIAGMIAGIAAGAAFALTKHFDMAERWFWFAGAVLVQCRLLANMFDGMVAIESGKTSLVGELYNEVPDRISDMGILIGFGYSFGTSPTLGYMAATLAILV
ncbi:MAG: CDP-alcohol phosphatidyltransferase family protein, partial [Verrucomicrobia bacterium]|nr:CDP-alcohol phosphatidyltransferase family protein [Verrucomicrobiota bacterium]